MDTKKKLRAYNFCDSNNANLLQNPNFQFAQKHSLNLYRSNAIYSFIPKNGCTTLRASIAANNGFLTDNDEISKHINWVHNNTYTFNASLRELARAEYTFTIIRCPYARLVSLFLDKFIDKTPVAWIFYRLSNNIYNLDKLTFTDFVDYLYNNPSSVNGDIHWRRQSDFLIYKEYDNYFKFENFDNIAKTLDQKLGLKLIDTRHITKHGRELHQNTTNNNFSRTTTNELLLLKLQGQLPSIENMLTSDIKNKIDTLYKHDFKLINRVF